MSEWVSLCVCILNMVYCWMVLWLPLFGSAWKARNTIIELKLRIEFAQSKVSIAFGFGLDPCNCLSNTLHCVCVCVCFDSVRQCATVPVCQRVHNNYIFRRIGIQHTHTHRDGAGFYSRARYECQVCAFALFRFRFIVCSNFADNNLPTMYSNVANRLEK